MHVEICQHPKPLQWRHNGCDGNSNHRRFECLLNRLFRLRLKKTPTLQVTGLCEGYSLVTGEFPTQRASNAEDVSICLRHHAPWLTGDNVNSIMLLIFFRPAGGYILFTISAPYLKVGFLKNLEPTMKHYEDAGYWKMIARKSVASYSIVFPGVVYIFEILWNKRNILTSTRRCLTIFPLFLLQFITYKILSQRMGIEQVWWRAKTIINIF